MFSFPHCGRHILYLLRARERFAPILEYRMCPCDLMHLRFDSYCDLGTHSSNRNARATSSERRDLPDPQELPDPAVQRSLASVFLMFPRPIQCLGQPMEV